MTCFFNLDWYENLTEWVMDYNGLSNPFEFTAQLGITNTYKDTIYLKAELITPPAGYSEYSKELGSLATGISAYRAFAFKRAHPGAKVTDNLTLRVTAYTDAGYSVELCHDELAVPFYLFDHNSLDLIDHDTFDTPGDLEGWAGQSAYCRTKQEPDFWISAPYSLGAVTYGAFAYANCYYVTKTFAIEDVAEAFFVYHYYKTTNTGVSHVLINDVPVIPSTVLIEYATGAWYRICLKMPVNQNVVVKLGALRTDTGEGFTIYQRFDEIWCVTSP